MAGFNLFGFEISRKRAEQNLQPQVSAPVNDDGAITVTSGGYFGTYLDLEANYKNENDLITRYREMAMQPELEAAIDDIINEGVVHDDKGKSVSIILDDLEQPDKIKDMIRAEFDAVLRLLDFSNSGSEIFRRWYIDGRLFYQVLIDENNVKAGIQELRYIDPRKIRRIKNIKRERTPQGVEVIKEIEEYFLYNDKGITEQTTHGVKLALDSVVHVPSGYTDPNTGMAMSYLHKAIKPVNQLKMIEDSLRIYRISRAPERRIFYIDVGNLPKMKAEQYVRDIMVKHKNRLIYDADSGNIRDDRKFMTMLEDYWLPRRDGGKGTEVTTLPGGQTLGQMDDVLYFQKKFFQTLNVPVNRLNSDALFSLGRATEVTRDELKFARFISRLRAKFAALFIKMLEKQLVLKQVLTIEDFENISADLKFDFAKDNYFTELKDGEILENRINLARNFQDMVGKYYSQEWLRRNILQQSEDDIEEMDKQIEEEADSGDPRWLDPNLMQNEMMASDLQMNEGGGTDVNPLANDEDTDATPKTDEKNRKIQSAKSTYDLLVKKKNRTLSDEAKLKSATQILAKNK